ncbi:A24 family peptidase [Caviibacterium pharyngocola]|uniref:Flp operon protein B n=1 Tax=Caviibacterium pharyngocola TaxID=28159 RepID=A0A2M8RWU7_9PAST|nr:prepilin peptidase [Caviibacterium pharyngocola]PJG83354.1 flp operon protein B [Caviibacterium pharyngocola]
MIKEYATITVYCLITLILLGISYSDIKSRIISNKCIGILFPLVIALAWLNYETVFVLSAVVALVICFLLFTLKVMGGGDAKMISVLMLALPNEQIISFVFFTALSGLVVVIIGLIFFRTAIREQGLPYGVAISCGFLINLLLIHL